MSCIAIWPFLFARFLPAVIMSVSLTLIQDQGPATDPEKTLRWITEAVMGTNAQLVLSGKAST